MGFGDPGESNRHKVRFHVGCSFKWLDGCKTFRLVQCSIHWLDRRYPLVLMKRCEI